MTGHGPAASPAFGIEWWPITACEPWGPDRTAHCFARLSERIFASVVLGVMASGSIRSSITPALPEASTRSKADANCAVSYTSSPTAPKDRA